MASIRPYFLSTDHYGLVVSTCDFLGIQKFIDERIPKTSNNQKLTYGQLFVCMLVNALSYVSKPLYLTPTFFKNVDIKTLFGDNFDISYLNDDALGRLLDKLYEADVSKLFLDLTMEAMKKLQRDVRCTHLDSTSFHLHGEKYNDPSFGEQVHMNIDTVENSDEKKAIKAELGYSRDSHPELLQVMLQMITDSNGIPVYMKPQDGNTNDNTGFQTSFSIVKGLKDAINFKYLVADAALFTQDNIKELETETEGGKKLLYITRAPNKINAVKELILKVKQENKFEEITTDYSGRLTDFEYAGVKFKALCVISKPSQGRIDKSIESKIKKEIESVEGKINKLSRRKFSCEPDAKKEAEELTRKFKFVKIKAQCIRSEPVYKRGKRNEESQPVSYNYFVEMTIERNEEAILLAKEEQSVFVIVTNDIESDWTAAQLLSDYKSQQRVERGFRFLKDPQFFADSFFLKTPERIEALLMVMVTSLFVYSSTEYIIRDKLKKQNKTLPNQTNKEVQNPTVRWIYSMFSNVGRYISSDNESFCVGLTDFQQRTIELLGDNWLQMYRHFFNDSQNIN